ncbi:hypothetical protein A2318_04125 [Candidatus Uhrbacteria bacterium RIFOXYB2_FULL_45_11]|uniref:Uncharacterized protein n=1 Tax=Candidatus Uhrbacteria bacterium RIFOXYB2_FULL_45_11 TaxID=1802421 RepID=A0A1F7W3J7_9BACT|nr:MAG: hypothetical protein A2318_04125 [Candidatus Uhrbacteria bacterium RIFOXYB2_FULL_45_11]
MRLDLSIHEARILLQKAGLDIWRTGIILRFKECPDCAKDEVLSPDIFTINVPDSELEFFHAAVA